MEIIEVINEILKKVFSVDIFNHEVSDKNELAEKIGEKIDKYFTYKLLLQDIIKSIYGEDAEIIMKEIVIEDVPSNIEKLNLIAPDSDRVLTLSDLGYKSIEINYYVKQPRNGELIYIGANKNIVNKYCEILTENGFMNKLEQTLNIELNPNTEHNETCYERKFVYPPYYYHMTKMPAEYNPYDGTIILEANVRTTQAIKTKDGNTIAKMIDCKHFDGYSTDKFRADKVKLDFDFKQNNLVSDLKKIPNEVLEKLKKSLRNHFYTNETDIVNDIIEILKEYVNEDLNLLSNIFFKYLSDIYSSYSEIVEYCSVLKVDLPSLNYAEIENFKNWVIENKKKTLSMYEEEKLKAETDLKNVGEKEDNLRHEVEKILEHANHYWEFFCSKETNIFAIDENEIYRLWIYQHMETLYREFELFFNQKDSVTIEQIREHIENVRREIDFGRSFETIYHRDYCSLNDSDLPFAAAERLVDFIEEKLNSNNTLVNDIIKQEELYKKIERKLESNEQNYENEKSLYENMIYHLSAISSSFCELLYNSERSLKITESLDQIDSICDIGIKNSEEYKKLFFYIGLFDSVVSGTIFNENLEQNDKYVGFLESKSSQHQNENYVELIKKQLKYTKH